ncbi:MAG: hypothetical protein JNK63_05295 [Chthonomonas sp.]|nr:hypothetical protein [Chthonomonas sp.]
MKKLFIFSLLTVAFASVLAGCGGPAAETPTGENTSAGDAGPNDKSGNPDAK